MDPQRLHDDEPRATSCPRLVVRDVFIRRQVVATEIGRVRRNENPVRKLDVADPHRREAPRISLIANGFAHRTATPSGSKAENSRQTRRVGRCWSRTASTLATLGTCNGDRRPVAHGDARLRQRLGNPDLPRTSAADPPGAFASQNCGLCVVAAGNGLHVLVGLDSASSEHTIRGLRGFVISRRADADHSSTRCGVTAARGASVTTIQRPFRFRHKYPAWNGSTTDPSDRRRSKLQSANAISTRR